MKVFLTGSTGFIGGHVARELNNAGAKLRVLTRKTSCLDNLESLGAEVVVGDLREPNSFCKAIQGCDALVHVAASYRYWKTSHDQMQLINVDATRCLLKYAKKYNVKKIVYTSSVATMKFTEKGSIVNEQTPASFEDMIGHYKRSKFLAEQVALDAAKQGQHVVILNPTTPVGANDASPTPTGRIIIDFLKGRFPVYINTGLNIVDVIEVARAHVSALTRGSSGSRYILGGENMTLKELLDRLSKLTGLPSPNLRIPHSVALAYAYLDEFFTGFLCNKEPRAVVEEVRIAKKIMYASSELARKDLEFNVSPVDPALNNAITWFKNHEYAPRKL
jgi:dihydroflavonol-4-reductase